MSATDATTVGINILTAPAAAFAALKERPTVLVPLLLLLAAAAATAFLYMNGVDILWFFEQQAGQNPDVTEEQAQQFAELIGSIPQAGIAAVLACAAMISVAVLLLLQALYFKIVTWISRDGVSYKHWFSMVAWCALPTLLTSIASIVKLLTSDVSLLPREEINPLSLANLTGIDTASGGALAGLLSNLDLMTLWSLVLMVVCYKTFTGRNYAVSFGIVLLPTVALVTLAALS